LVEARTKVVNAVRGFLRGKAKRLQKGGVETLPARVLALGEVASHIERLLIIIEELNKQIKEADRELSTLAKADETCRRLMTVPGVGPVTAVRFVAMVDEVGRFENAHKLESYLGLTPGENSSSDRKRMTSITKAGSAKMRWCLIQAAWSCRMTRQHQPIKDWADAIEKRRGRAIATVALARKIAGILYALWRDGSQYDPMRGSETITT
jgi:transposase